MTKETRACVEGSPQLARELARMNLTVNYYTVVLEG